MIASKKNNAVQKSIKFEFTFNPVSLSTKYLIKDAGKFSSPN